MKTEKKKRSVLKIVLICIGVAILLSASIVGGYYVTIKGVLFHVKNGWKASADYRAEITNVGVPDTYEASCQTPGTVVELDYRVENYADPGIVSTKTAQIYLPHGYDASQKYNIIYLLHGGEKDGFAGAHFRSWLSYHPVNKNVVDNLIAFGDIAPVIIVTPTIYMPDSLGIENNWSFEQFAYELRNDLIPAVESQYATYAEGDVSAENITATREHRAMAGLSMGSMHTINVGLMKMLDCFAWYGSFSGARTEAADISAALHSDSFEQFDIKGLLVVNGRFDTSYKEHFRIMRELEKNDVKLTEDENFLIVDVKNGTHDWPNWEVALYDLLQYIFS